MTQPLPQGALIAKGHTLEEQTWVKVLKSLELMDRIQREILNRPRPEHGRSVGRDHSVKPGRK